MSSLNENIEYHIISINECDRISEIGPSQWIEKAWRFDQDYRDILKAWDINRVVDFEEYVTSAIRLTTANEKNYVLKRKGNIQKINTEHELLKHIQNNGIVVPVPLKTAKGNLYVEKHGVNYTLYDYIEGTTIQYDFEKDNKDVLFKHGQVLGKLHRVMNTYNGTNEGIVDMNIENEVLNWAIPLINKNISDNKNKEIIDDIAKEMTDIFIKLPKQYIHRDPHGRNILFQGDSFIGFIDFDLCKIGYKVFDLCYVMTGVLMDGFEKEGNKEKWLDLITQISRGYETENSIEPVEKESFWYIFLAIQMICTAWFYQINDSKMAKLNIEALYWIYDNKELIQSKIK